MRCKNCGWSNDSNVRTCVKCGNYLGEETHDHSASSKSTPDTEGTKKTVMENSVFGKGHESSDSLNDEKSCPQCGYPLRPNTDKCPNCNYLVNENGQLTQNANLGGLQSGGVHRGTINPYLKVQQAGPSFVLQPVQRYNERNILQPIELQGDEVILNRDNTDPDNPSITSAEQAVLSFANGHWYLEDRSEMKTTFVQAAHKIEVRSGDIILLGDRLFEFKEK